MSYPQVVTQQPPAGAAYNAPRLWSSGTFSCFDDWKSCVMGYFCSICLAMQVSTNMGESACVPWVVPNAITVLRTKMRHMYNIEGTVLMTAARRLSAGPVCGARWPGSRTTWRRSRTRASGWRTHVRPPFMADSPTPTYSACVVGVHRARVIATVWPCHACYGADDWLESFGAIVMTFGERLNIELAFTCWT